MPDLARPLAVAGEPRRGQRIDRHALGAERRPDWLTPVRRNIACSVRTWRSSPEWLPAMIAISAGSSSNSCDAARLEQREEPERLDARSGG